MRHAALVMWANWAKYTHSRISEVFFFWTGLTGFCRIVGGCIGVPNNYGIAPAGNPENPVNPVKKRDL